jgi:hypothetical protein
MKVYCFHGIGCDAVKRISPALRISRVALAVLFQVEPFALALILTVLTFLGFSRAADSPRLPLEALIGMLSKAQSESSPAPSRLYRAPKADFLLSPANIACRR